MHFSWFKFKKETMIVQMFDYPHITELNKIAKTRKCVNVFVWYNTYMSVKHKVPILR